MWSMFCFSTELFARLPPPLWPAAPFFAPHVATTAPFSLLLPPRVFLVPPSPLLLPNFVVLKRAFVQFYFFSNLQKRGLSHKFFSGSLRIRKVPLRWSKVDNFKILTRDHASQTQNFTCRFPISSLRFPWRVAPYLFCGFRGLKIGKRTKFATLFWTNEK